jgi:hypothetical protein
MNHLVIKLRKYALARMLFKIIRKSQRFAAMVQGRILIRADRHEWERQRLSSNSSMDFPMGIPYPITVDRFALAGEASGHYFHQDLLVAQEIFKRNPRRHIDVGSSVYGFVSHVASFREIEVMDIRPLDNEIPAIRFVQQNLMVLNERWTGVADSLSCLHALEHFGLGRYGDPIDYEGWQKGLHNLSVMLEPGGLLYFSVPTGMKQRVEFNAHRVFSLPYLRGKLLQYFQVEGLSFVDDKGKLLRDVDPYGPEAEVSFNANYGCSVWILRKPLLSENLNEEGMR